MLKRNIKITFRLNAKEHQRLKKNVKKTGLSQETYIRTLLAGYAPKELPPPDYHSMMRELNAIGNSINQIAARAKVFLFLRKIGGAALIHLAAALCTVWHSHPGGWNYVLGRQAALRTSIGWIRQLSCSCVL